MPVQWTLANESIRLDGNQKGPTVVITQNRRSNTIGLEDASRQTYTAAAILEKLNHQPGIILADEVGMGKTYVALAVVASVLEAERKGGRPIVVMVPTGLATKWQNEWMQFKTLCVRENAFDWVRDGRAHNPGEFFKLLDDPSSTRKHLIFITTSCFHQGFTDRWMKLAFIRGGRAKTRMTDEMKARLFRWATSLVRLKNQRLSEELIEKLLSSKLVDWKQILVREGHIREADDDPIPEQLVRHIDSLDFTEIIKVIRGDRVPKRTSSTINERLKDLRKSFNDACDGVYKEWLQKTDWRAPLLVLDEAHHAKNDGTRLAGLFRSQETVELLDGAAPGNRTILWEKFDRMLFLTATPFQLGHHELIRILRSFAAAYWKRDRAPDKSREQFQKSLDELSKRLDVNRQYGKRLDECWGNLKREQFGAGIADQPLEAAVLEWWERIERLPTGAQESSLVQAVNDCISSRMLAEKDPSNPWQSLSTWVVRHNRSATLPRLEGDHSVPRREKRIGASIALGSDGSASGLSLSKGTALPFLLAVRAQGELAASSSSARAFFAEGLCSSYEAFHHTRDGRGDVRDTDDEGNEQTSKETKQNKIRSVVPVDWYENQVKEQIPSLKASRELRYNHPKIRPVVERTVDLWAQGEKVLVFCFYRETAKALRDHLKKETEKRVFSLIARKLNLKNDEEIITQALTRIIRRLSDDGVFHDALVSFLEGMLDNPDYAILKPYREDILEMLQAYFRSPAFLARYVPFEREEVRAAFAENLRDAEKLRKGALALIDAIKTDDDGSKTTTKQRIALFLDFATELAERSRLKPDAEDGENKSLLAQYLEAVAVYSSPRRSKLDDDEDAKLPSDEGSYRVLPVVRMVYGDTTQDVRQRLMSAFNSPLFPEILVSSAVLGEGVDLHRFCRYVVHHDLCWNPSTLEQRTGRLDRIRCKAEYSQQPIVIYEPYIGGSADEKMFRVVQDRERWFQVVMGQKFEFNEASSEKIADRVPLPQKLAQKLIFDLRLWTGTP